MLERIARSFTTNIVQFPRKDNPFKLELGELSMPVVRPQDLRESPALIPLNEKLQALHRDDHCFSGIIDCSMWWTISGEVWQEHLSRHLHLPIIDWTEASSNNNYLVGFDILYEPRQVCYLERMLRKRCRAFQGKLFYAILINALSKEQFWLSRSSMSVIRCTNFVWDEQAGRLIPKLELVQDPRLF